MNSALGLADGLQSSLQGHVSKRFGPDLSAFDLPHLPVRARAIMVKLMKPSRPALETVVPILRQQWSRFRVRQAWLFGSRASGERAATSDWDFLVEFSEPPSFDIFMGLKTGLEESLNSRVDLLSRSACRPRFLKAIKNQLVDVT